MPRVPIHHPHILLSTLLALLGGVAIWSLSRQPAESRAPVETPQAATMIHEAALAPPSTPSIADLIPNEPSEREVSGEPADVAIRGWTAKELASINERLAKGDLSVLSELLIALQTKSGLNHRALARERARLIQLLHDAQTPDAYECSLYLAELLDSGTDFVAALRTMEAYEPAMARELALARMGSLISPEHLARLSSEGWTSQSIETHCTAAAYVLWRYRDLALWPTLKDLAVRFPILRRELTTSVAFLPPADAERLGLDLLEVRLNPESTLTYDMSYKDIIHFADLRFPKVRQRLLEVIANSPPEHQRVLIAEIPVFSPAVFHSNVSGSLDVPSSMRFRLFYDRFESARILLDSLPAYQDEALIEVVRKARTGLQMNINMAKAGRWHEKPAWSEAAVPEFQRAAE